MKKAEQQEPLDLSVSLPAVVNEPLSFYCTQLQAVIDTGLTAPRFRVRLSSSSSAFQHVAGPSFLRQLPLSLTGPLVPGRRHGRRHRDGAAAALWA